jgi:multifunctional beta-oxidation protein
VKENIFSNVIAPIAASRMTATVLPSAALELLKPEWVVPLVAVLTHSSSRENGSIFEVGGGNIAKLRRERSKGLLLNPEEGYSPSAILNGWSELHDFSVPEHPNGPIDFLARRKTSQYRESGEGGPEIRFDDKVVLITGGGAG